MPKKLRFKGEALLASIGKRPVMLPETRAWLIEHYHSHNKELEKVLEVDLSNWNK